MKWTRGPLMRTIGLTASVALVVIHWDARDGWFWVGVALVVLSVVAFLTTGSQAYRGGQRFTGSQPPGDVPFDHLLEDGGDLVHTAYAGVVDAEVDHQVASGRHGRHHEPCADVLAGQYDKGRVLLLPSRGAATVCRSHGLPWVGGDSAGGRFHPGGAGTPPG